MDDSTLIIMLITGAVVLVSYFAMTLLTGGGKSRKLRDRLNGAEANEDSASARDAAKQAVVPWIQKMGQRAAEPFLPKSREKQSDLRKRLAYAGIYAPTAQKMVAGSKVILMGLGVIVGFLVGQATDQMLLGLSVGGLIGYMTPIFWLRMKIKSNQMQLQLSLPDALDLMVVCVEAGLTVDAAMQRVGQELLIAHPALSRELGMTHMETRVGLSRAESMKNLGVRTGSVPLQSLASMLIQADRFGTSIAQALRIHAETLRQQRQHAAEEMAAKASVKMSFPLVLFIFPATFIVLAGPTVIQLMRSEIMK